jgi:hypothetical protein
MDDQLLGQERVPFGNLDHARAPLSFKIGAQRVNEYAHFGLGQRREGKRSLRPCRSCLEQLGPRKAEQKHRAGCLLFELLDQVEERRLGPVHILEDNDKWLPRSNRLEKPSERPVRLLERCGFVGEAGCTSDSARY